MKNAWNYVSFLLGIVLCLGLAGCANTESSEDAKVEAAEAFLTEFFTFNKQQRYYTFFEAIDGADGREEGADAVLEKQRQAYEEYYRPFADMATQSCIDQMQANRLPLKYDELVAQEEISAQISAIHCEASNDNAIDFEISFDCEETNEYFQAPVTGRVTIQAAGGRVCVDSIAIY